MDKLVIRYEKKELLHKGIKEIRTLILIAKIVRTEGEGGRETYRHCNSKLKGYNDMLCSLGIYNEKKRVLMTRIISDAIS